MSNNSNTESNSFLSSITQYFKKGEDKTEESSLLKNLFKPKTTESFSIFQTAEDRAVRLRKAMICLIIASVLLFGALSFLPTFIVFPKNFAILFSIGCMFIHIALGYMKSTHLEYVQELFTGNENIIVSACYFSSVIFSIFAAVFLESYILVMISIILQIVGICWFISNMFPGGYEGFLNLLKYGFKMCPCFSGDMHLPI